MSEKLLLEMEHVRKKFPGVLALDDMHLQLKAGEVHALLGENGAGKSTLIKILSGIYKRDAGTIRIDGEEVDIESVVDATACGIRTIHQELVMVPGLSITENIFLGREITRSGFVNWSEMNRAAQKMLDDFGVELRTTDLVETLTIAQQQMVEIVKAVSFNARIIIMDEPTSSLSDKETAALFACIRRLRAQGIGIIYISHRMSELFEVVDRVTVMRDGRYITTQKISETNVDELVKYMVGREVTNFYTRNGKPGEEVVFAVRNLSNQNIRNVSFELHKGEILGVSGLVGAGRTETLRAIFGIDKLQSGTIEIHGRQVKIRKPQDAVDNGVVLIPEDRKKEGIFPRLSVQTNITLKVLSKFIHGISVNKTAEYEIAKTQFQSLKVKAASMDTELQGLSGGNQQKVIIARWVATEPDVILLDEPTRGIDVGAKAEIYSIMDELTKKGISIIMVSSELPEVINMSDRVVVMRGGEVSAVLGREEMTQETIMKYSVVI